MSRLITKAAWILYAAMLVGVLMIVFDYAVKESAKAAEFKLQCAEQKKELQRCQVAQARRSIWGALDGQGED